MQVKFKTETYDCLSVRQSNSNDGANRLALLLENVDSIDELKEEVTGCERIEVTDGSDIQVYEDYINYVGISEGEGTVEVNLQQDNAIKKLEKLTAVVAEQKAVIAEQAQTIAEQQNMISEQANRIAELEGSQSEQDENIEGLGDAIIEMSEIVYA